jgi:predicted NAD/FAD-dependent oxidoreductase
MKIAILGCGVAGLSAAHDLRARGIGVKLFDKSRGVGGRMSTRYAGDWEFDHGAQFFTVQDPEFKAAIDEAVSAGVVAPWPAKALYMNDGQVSEDTGRARYVGQPRMNALPKYWASGLDIELGRRVNAITRNDRGGVAGDWTLVFEDGSETGGFNSIISTLPPAQLQPLLPANFQYRHAVTAAKMHACFALMVGLDNPIDPGWDTLRVKNLPINWIAINHAKPGRARDVGTLVIHAEADWSDKYAEADRDWVQEVMLDTASALIGVPLAGAPHVTLHRWLYASSKTSPGVPCLVGDGFVAAGDWCLGGRVQGAWLSGRAAARVFA